MKLYRIDKLARLGGASDTKHEHTAEDGYQRCPDHGKILCSARPEDCESLGGAKRKGTGLYLSYLSPFF